MTSLKNKLQPWLTILFMVATLFHASQVWGADRVRVVAVIDGDTVKVLHAKRQEKVRLAFIDAPEMHQPYGKTAKQALAQKVLGHKIRLERHDVDQYGRTVATLWHDGVNINLQMVEEGHAWVYKRYTKDPLFFQAQHHAEDLKLGLWQLPQEQREPPWQWRKQEAAHRHKSK